MAPTEPFGVDEVDADNGPSQSGKKAAFLASLWAAIAVVGASVVGIAHARSVVGHAQTPFWIIVALVTVAGLVVGVAYARLPMQTTAGRAARMIAVPVMAVAIALFVWETTVVGSGASSPPAPSALLTGRTATPPN